MDEVFEQKLLTEHDENAKKPIKSNMVENVKVETIESYEKALALGDRETVSRIEWELQTLTIHKKELREFIEDRKAKGLNYVPTTLDIAEFEEYKNPKPVKPAEETKEDAKPAVSEEKEDS